jgi:hypothetical protein
MPTARALDTIIHYPFNDFEWPLLARNGHGAMSELSPLSRVERKSHSRAGRTAFDPTATLHALSLAPVASLKCKSMAGPSP